MSGYNLKEEVTDKYSLRGRVFHKIREDILNGKYKENDELREAAIGEELGVSRTPVREAFRQLELEGLISIVPNKGAYVTGITSKDIADIYMIRSLLEGLCAGWAAEKISEEQLQEMEENVYLSEFHAQKGHTEQIAVLDNRFHEIMKHATVKCWSIHSRIFINMYTGSENRRLPRIPEGMLPIMSTGRLWRQLKNIIAKKHQSWQSFIC